MKASLGSRQQKTLERINLIRRQSQKKPVQTTNSLMEEATLKLPQKRIKVYPNCLILIMIFPRSLHQELHQVQKRIRVYPKCRNLRVENQGKLLQEVHQSQKIIRLHPKCLLVVTLRKLHQEVWQNQKIIKVYQKCLRQTLMILRELLHMSKVGLKKTRVTLLVANLRKP